MLFLQQIRNHSTSLFECHYTESLWQTVHIVFGVMPPLSVEHLFNRWYKQGRNQYNSLLLTGAAAFCWSICLTRNDVVFDKYQSKTYLQVLFRGARWLRF